MTSGSGSRRGFGKDTLKEDFLQQKRKQKEFEQGWEIYYKKSRKYHNRKNRKGKDWVPTKQEVEDEKEIYPVVRNYYDERFDALRKVDNFNEEEFWSDVAALRAECKRMNKEIDQREEAEFWAAWNEPVKEEASWSDLGQF